MASVWRDVVILTIRETPSKSKAGSGFGMWVIQKLRDGAHYNVTLRAGNYFTNQVSGEKQYPKDGMTDWDFEALKKSVPGLPEKAPGKPTLYWDIVMPLLDRKNPPPVPEPESQPDPEPAGPPEPERMPWE